MLRLHNQPVRKQTGLQSQHTAERAEIVIGLRLYNQPVRMLETGLQSQHAPERAEIVQPASAQANRVTISAHAGTC